MVQEISANGDSLLRTRQIAARAATWSKRAFQQS
jgi:hypothetical protein